jgi:glyoxylase-like metal-dependent hydrolase (beta-lactamase superfamily II)
MQSRPVDVKAIGASVCAVVVAAAAVSAAQRGGPPTAPSPPAATRLVQGKVYVVGPGDANGSNVVLQVGADGVLLVDTQPADAAQRVFAAVRTLSPEPIRWIVDTSARADHMGGNDALIRLGTTPASVGRTRVVAHENVVHRLVANTSISRDAWPNDDFFTPDKDFFFNGEAVIVTHMPRAATDGDSIVFFRRSDVIATGDVFVPGQYPSIDLAAGGSVQGEIDALNTILHVAVPAKYQEGGTYIVPGHGRICDEADVVEYRDMLTVVRDRVQDLIRKRSTLEQVKAARPSRDYDSEYTRSAGPSPDAFVEVVYRSLTTR